MIRRHVMTWSIEMFWCTPVRWSCDVMWTLYHFRDAGVPFLVEAIFGLAPQKACCCDRSERRVLKE